MRFLLRENDVFQGPRPILFYYIKKDMYLTHQLQTTLYNIVGRWFMKVIYENLEKIRNTSSKLDLGLIISQLTHIIVIKQITEEWISSNSRPTQLSLSLWQIKNRRWIHTITNRRAKMSIVKWDFIILYKSHENIYLWIVIKSGSSLKTLDQLNNAFFPKSKVVVVL